MTATRKPVKNTGVHVGEKSDRAEEKASADKASDHERFNKARTALPEISNHLQQ